MVFKLFQYVLKKQITRCDSLFVTTRTASVRHHILYVQESMHSPEQSIDPKQATQGETEIDRGCSAYGSECNLYSLVELPRMHGIYKRKAGITPDERSKQDTRHFAEK